MAIGGLIAVFLASIVGSVHCAAMCGGLAGFCSGASKKPAVASFGYHTGRGISYCLLGAIVGGFGAEIDAVGQTWGLSYLASIGVGCILLAWGACSVLSNRTPKFISIIVSSISGVFSKQLAIARERNYPSIAIGGITGLLTVFLPCGWLHAFVLICVASGSASNGALAMGAFWLGSIPALVLVSTGVSFLKPVFAKNAPRVGGLLLITAGLLSIFARDSLMNLVPSSMMDYSSHHSSESSNESNSHKHTHH